MIYVSQERLELWEAVGCALRAADALMVPTSGNKAAAILWLARALVHIASTDPEEKARKQAVDVVKELIAEKRARATR